FLFSDPLKEIIDKTDSLEETQSGEEENLSTDHSTGTEKPFKNEESVNDISFLRDSISYSNPTASDVTTLRYAAKAWPCSSNHDILPSANKNDHPSILVRFYRCVPTAAPLFSISQKSPQNSLLNDEGGSLSDYTVSLQQHLTAWQSQLKDLHGREYDASRPHGKVSSTFPSVDIEGIKDLPVCMRTLMTLMLEMQSIQKNLIDVQQRLIETQVQLSTKTASPSAYPCWEDLIQTAFVPSPFTTTVLASPPSLTSSICTFPYTYTDPLRQDTPGMVMSTYPPDPLSTSTTSSSSTPMGIKSSGYSGEGGDRTTLATSPSMPLGRMSLHPLSCTSPSHTAIDLADLIECAPPFPTTRRRMETFPGRAGGTFPSSSHPKRGGTTLSYSDEETYFYPTQNSTNGGEGFSGTLHDKKRLRGLPYPIREDAPMPGVRYARDRNSWVAFWCERGRQNYKSFSNKKFGFERARQMAIEARVAFDKRQASESGELPLSGTGGFPEDPAYLSYVYEPSTHYFSSEKPSTSSSHPYTTLGDTDIVSSSHHPFSNLQALQGGHAGTPPSEEEEESYPSLTLGDTTLPSTTSSTVLVGNGGIDTSPPIMGGRQRFQRSGGGGGPSASNAPMNKNEYQQLASSLKNPKGVCYAPSNNTWMAYGGHSSGARMCKSFPVHKYGFYEARNLAISALSEGRRGGHLTLHDSVQIYPENTVKRSKMDEGGRTSSLLPTVEAPPSSEGDCLLKAIPHEEEGTMTGVSAAPGHRLTPPQSEEIFSTASRKRGARSISNQRRIGRRPRDPEATEEYEKLNGVEDVAFTGVSASFGCSYYDSPTDAWICSYRDTDRSRKTKRFLVSNNGGWESTKKLAESFLHAMQEKSRTSSNGGPPEGPFPEEGESTVIPFSEGDEGSDVSSQRIVTRSRRGSTVIEEGGVGRNAPQKENGECERSRERPLTQDIAAIPPTIGKPSHVKGVNFNRQCNTWAAIWYVNGVQQVKYFSVKQYGYEDARRLAIEHRQKIDANKLLRSSVKENRQSVGLPPASFSTTSLPPNEGEKESPTPDRVESSPIHPLPPVWTGDHSLPPSLPVTDTTLNHERALPPALSLLSPVEATKEKTAPSLLSPLEEIPLLKYEHGTPLKEGNATPPSPPETEAPAPHENPSTLPESAPSLENARRVKPRMYSTTNQRNGFPVYFM
ncbi:AP2 domain transcription factor AP2VIII-7, partial [Cardiosporidium cionae]